MARDSYPVPLHAVDTDIDKVGGKGAFLGMLREGTDGKRYVLVQSPASGMDMSAGKLILGMDGGEAFKVALASDQNRCNGVSAALVNIPANSYFWMQTYGRADSVYSNGTKGSYIGSAGSGVGETLTVDLTIDEGGAAVVTLNGYLGWGMDDSASTLQSVFIDPGFVTV